MARIRTVKPEFWADEKLAALPRDARLLFIGLWNFCDDEGRLRANPILVRSQVFPYDSDLDVESLLRSLTEASLIVRYVVGEQSYLFVRNFRKHQKIERPSKSQLPAPPDDLPPRPPSGLPPPVADSPSTHRILTEASVSPHPRIGREGKGGERKKEIPAEVPAGPGEPQAASPPEDPEPEPTAEQTACRRAFATAYAAEYERRSGSQYAWSAKERAGVKALSGAVGNDPAEACRVLAVFVERMASDAFYAKNFKPSFIASEVNALRLPPVARGQGPPRNGSPGAHSVLSPGRPPPKPGRGILPT